MSNQSEKNALTPGIIFAMIGGIVGLVGLNILLAVLVVVATGAKLSKAGLPKGADWPSMGGSAGGGASAQELTSLSVDAANARGIAQSATVYVDAHHVYPPHLAALLVEGAIVPKALVSRNGHTSLYSGPLEGGWKAIASDVDAHCDFTYIGQDLPGEPQNDAAIILLYSNVSIAGRRIVAFADAHSEQVYDQNIPNVFEQSNRRRDELGLPSLAFGGPPPAPRTTPWKPPVVAGGTRPPTVVVPPPNLPKTKFTSVDEALSSVRSGAVYTEKLAAVKYLADGTVVPAKRKDVVAALVPLWNEPQYAADAVRAIRKWANAEDAPEIRGYVQSKIGGDPSRMDPVQGRNLMIWVEQLLQWKDKESLPLAFSMLRNPLVHDAARDALVANPAGVEDFAKTVAMPTENNPAAMDAVALLGKVGTDKSIPVLQGIMTDKNPELAKAAKDALTQLGDRLKLKPEDILYNLFNRYEIAGPAGFVLDKTVDAPTNTKQWTRTAPGRSVKSIYAVQVKYVGKDYKLGEVPNANTIVAGTLTFKQLEAAPAPQFTQAAHYAALDGEYLIEFMAVLDTADTTAATAMNNAVKKIKAK